MMKYFAVIGVSFSIFLGGTCGWLARLCLAVQERYLAIFQLCNDGPGGVSDPVGIAKARVWRHSEECCCLVRFDWCCSSVFNAYLCALSRRGIVGSSGRSFRSRRW